MILETGQTLSLSQSKEGAIELVSKPLVNASSLGEIIRTFHKRSSNFKGIRVLIPRNSERYVTIIARGRDIEAAKGTLDKLLDQLTKSFQVQIDESLSQLKAHRQHLLERNVQQMKGLKRLAQPNFNLTDLYDRNSLLISKIDQAIATPGLKNISIFDGFATSKLPVSPPRKMLYALSLIFSIFAGLVVGVGANELTSR